ncbi:LytTR family transcriptional regulator DNA-binding domain-containing protein [Luteolibacter sp. Populi]|uniref:GAF domain-containing DNA-binding protein n=1 Tax=Luteolibacter sp. Populi TaxID=3230487 RepID=UPI003467AB8F
MAGSPFPQPQKSKRVQPREAQERSEDPTLLDNGFWEPLALAAAQTDASLDRALAHIGPFYRADRVWVGRYNEELTHFWGASDWVNTGVPSHIQEIQGIPVEFIGDAHGKFLKGEAVIIPDVERMPRQRRALQAELRREGVRATFSYPLMHSGNLIGFFGFDYVREATSWTAADSKRIPTLASYLAALLRRGRSISPPAGPPAAPDRSVFVNEQGSMQALSLEEILFIEADGDYTRVHLADGNCCFERRSLRSWIGQLPPERFMRVHQSYLVQAARIVRLDRGPRWTLHLQDVAQAIPVGRAFRHSLRLHMTF